MHETQMKDVERILLTNQQITTRIGEIADQITQDFKGKDLVIVGILNGAVFFYADLVRKIDLAVTVDFMSISSYGLSTKSSGVVRIIKDLDQNIVGKHVMIVEDIVDSGLSIKYIAENLKTRGALSISTCAMLDKPSRRKVDVAIDYLGFSIPDAFVVGYGLDYAQRYRNLNDICELKPSIYVD